MLSYNYMLYKRVIKLKNSCVMKAEGTARTIQSLRVNNRSSTISFYSRITVLWSVLSSII